MFNITIQVKVVIAIVGFRGLFVHTLYIVYTVYMPIGIYFGGFFDQSRDRHVDNVFCQICGLY